MQLLCKVERVCKELEVTVPCEGGNLQTHTNTWLC